MNKDIAKTIVGLIVIASIAFGPYLISYVVEYLTGDFIFDDDFDQYDVVTARWFVGLMSTLLCLCVVGASYVIGGWIIKK